MVPISLGLVQGPFESCIVANGVHSKESLRELLLSVSFLLKPGKGTESLHVVEVTLVLCLS